MCTSLDTVALIYVVIMHELRGCFRSSQTRNNRVMLALFSSTNHPSGKRAGLHPTLASLSRFAQMQSYYSGQAAPLSDEPPPTYTTHLL